MHFFDFSRCPLAAILDLRIPEILRHTSSRGPICIIMPNFIEIGQTVVKISRFFDFSLWRPSAILDLFSAFLDHPWSIFGGLYWCEKFGWNLRSSFDDVKVWIFRVFGLKMLIHDPKITVLGVFDPLNGEAYQQNPQKAHPCVERRHMTYRLSKSSTCATCAPVHESKKDKERNLTVANWLFAQTTHIVQSKYRLAWLVIFHQ